MRLSRPQLSFLAIGIAIALAVGACTSGNAAGGGSGSNATIRLASPADGSQVTTPFDVQIESSVPLGPPESGNHHAHLYFDTGSDAADYDIVYGNSEKVVRPLAPGTHTIIVALANPDHSLAGPTQQIKVTVGGSAPASGGGGPSSPPATPGTPAY